ncbi:MAG: hypothetical protein AVO33_05365 [delta proteobacterium ML8_F1]|nr:MAG: hypothetical protein AVO33_05365 [delta proteobacterium ML8_F1]
MAVWQKDYGKFKVAITLSPGGLESIKLISEVDAAMGKDPPEGFEALHEWFLSYLEGTPLEKDFPLDVTLTDFQRLVLMETKKIPFGQTITYGELAQKIQRPRAVRGVGGALGMNPLVIYIPCHRVIGSNGALRGYSGLGGLKTKETLIHYEKSLLINRG